MRAFSGPRRSSRTQSGRRTPSPSGGGSTAISRRAARRLRRRHDRQRRLRLTGAAVGSESPGRAQDRRRSRAGPGRVSSAPRRASATPSASWRSRGQRATSPPGSSRRRGAGGARAAGRRRCAELDAGARRPKRPPQLLSRGRARPGRRGSTIGGQPGRALHGALDARQRRQQRVQVRRLARAACCVSFSAAARRISHSMASGACVEALAVGVGAVRLQEAVGVVAVGQLDHLHAQPSSSRMSRLLRAAFWPAVVLVEVHHHALGEAPEQARVLRR